MTPTNKDPNLESVLKNALRRQDAPGGFGANVLARVAQHESSAGSRRGNWLCIFSQPLIRWAAFAAVSIGLAGGGLYVRKVERERAEGEAAKRQLMLALRIAGNKLQLAKTKVNEINQSHPEHQPEAIPRSRS